MANLEPIRNKRISELQTFARRIADDYGITDTKEVQALVQRVVRSFDPERPLLSVRSSSRADSMLYRHHIRSAYIDLLAYFIQLKYIELHLIKAESNIRDTIAVAEAELARLRKQFYLADTDTHITENFLQDRGKETTGTLIANHQLTLQPDSMFRADQVQHVKVTIYPPESEGSVLHQISGREWSIVRSGHGSGIWSAAIHADKMPSIYWDMNLSETYTAPVLINGVAVVVDITLSGKGLSLGQLSGNFMTPTRLVRAYVFENDNEEWIPLRAHDGTLLSSEKGYELSLHNIQSNIKSNRFRFLLSVEEPAIIGDRRIIESIHPDFIDLADNLLKQNDITFEKEHYFKYQFILGIFNLKLKEASYVTNGYYISEPYRTTAGAITAVRLISTDEERQNGRYNQLYRINFLASGKQVASIPILPENQLQVEEIIATKGGRIKPAFYLNTSRPYEVYHIKGYDLIDIKSNIQHDSDSNTLIVFPWYSDNETRSVLIRYYTTEINSVGYENNQTGTVSSQPPVDSAYRVRRLKPGMPGYKQVSVHEARPLITTPITEIFKESDFEGNVLKLRTVPYINYENFNWDTTDIKQQWLNNYQPIKVMVRMDKGSQAVSATDRTVWGNRQQQPILEDYAINNEVQFYLYKDQLHFNIQAPYEVTVEYETMAESFQVQIDMSTVDGKYTGIVRAYEVDINVQ